MDSRAPLRRGSFFCPLIDNSERHAYLRVICVSPVICLADQRRTEQNHHLGQLVQPLTRALLSNY